MLKEIKVLVITSLFSFRQLVFGAGLREAIDFSHLELGVERKRSAESGMQEAMDWILVSLPNAEWSDEVGKPQLPVIPKIVTLPKGERVPRIRVSFLEAETLPGEYLVFPAQRQYPLIFSQAKFDFTQPDPGVYNSRETYPQEVCQFVGGGNLFGERKAEFLIYPIQYQPKERRLIFHKKIQLDLLTEKRKRPKPNRQKMEGGFEYLVITTQPLATTFLPLIQWKTKKGVKAEIRQVEWIYAHYPGRDNPEKIRNYLKTLPDSGVKWVLLGGDVGLVPCRYAYAMTCSAFYHQREDLLPCDLYYSDLDGDWNFDRDTIFGEVCDSIDLYPDLFVGRAPVNTVSEAQSFVNKVLAYEKRPGVGYLRDVLFFAEVLWSNPYTDGGVHKDKMERESFSPFLVTKLYQSRGNLSRSAVMSSLREGKNLLNHDGHGWIDVMSTGGTSLRKVDMDTITNPDKYGILYSIGCWTSAFDYNSIAEAFLLNPRGGGVAFIGNSSYGWGSPGNPGYGYSEKFDNTFFYELLRNGRTLGEALAYAKIHYIPFSRQKNVYRWHQYQVNLLGDPELSVWTKEPDSLNVFAPASLPVGEGRVLISVAKDGRPIKSALVCLVKEGESYERGLTDERGEVFLRFRSESGGEFSLTVTAKNFYPWEGQIPILSGGYPNFQGFSINDSLGNGDRIPNPKETLFLSPLLKNCGDEPLSNIFLTLRSSDSLVSLLDSLSEISSLLPGESVLLANGFCVVIGDAEDGEAIYFDLLVRANGERVYKPSLLVGRSILKIFQAEVREKPSRPGQVKKLSISLYNSGFGIGHNTWASLFSFDPYITILSPESLSYGEIPPQSLVQIPDTFLISISPLCPSSYRASLGLRMRRSDGSSLDTFSILVGETGFSDDMERGDSLWQTGGVNNLWHISSRRAHSGQLSWYCGDEGSGRYNNNTNAFIQTRPFMVEDNSFLRFRRWFKFPNYGVDGIYVIIFRGNEPCTLDFIGSGGALGEGKVIESEWCEERYQLSFLDPGETISVRISFVSDNDGYVSEGIYIDDFSVEGGRINPPSAYREGVGERKISPFAIRVYPNPFKKFTNIYLSPKPEGDKRTILVYDIKGRMVSLLTTDGQELSLSWDGRDEDGRLLPSGLYFLRERESPSLWKKVLIVRE